ncbi:MAG: hypothetical protein OXC80_02160, partial [Gammaproteobacteria bacterium]|nr:hypothetical protein [Gammaproteobacteria bacterium]
MRKSIGKIGTTITFMTFLITMLEHERQRSLRSRRHSSQAVPSIGRNNRVLSMCFNRFLLVVWQALFTTTAVLGHGLAWEEHSKDSVVGHKFEPEEALVILDLLEECPILDAIIQAPSNSCMDRLAEHFSDQPVWQQSMVYYPVLDKFFTAGSEINRRPHELAFSKADITGDVPVWSDIFDNKQEYRALTLERTFQDSTCTQLAQRGPIQADAYLANRCESRELVKYVIYLDACLTGIGRVNELLSPRQIPIRPHETRYEEVMERWDRLPKNERLVAQIPLSESMLHAVWVRHSCSHMPSVAYDDGLQPYEWDLVGATVTEYAAKLQNTHDTAMAIAARSG